MIVEDLDEGIAEWLVDSLLGLARRSNCVSASTNRFGGYLIVICQTERNERDLVGELELGVGDIVRLALDAIDYCARCDG